MEQASPLNNEQFMVIVIPDTQMISANHPEILTTMTSWVVDHADECNLKMVLHLGDVVNAGASQETQFVHAKAALDLIDRAGIPMLIASGNHDYDNMLGENRNLTMFRKYFGMQRFRHQSWFGGTFEEGGTENAWARLEISGQKYLFLVLEFGPRDEVLAWADKVLQENLDSRAIVITHCYMYMYGARTGLGDEHNPKIYPGALGANDGENIWQKSLKKHANVVAVFSGHQISENISYRTDRGEQGNIVFQSFQNWQDAEAGGEGRIRIVTMKPSEDRMTLRVFNPYSGKFETEPGYEVYVSLHSNGTEQVRFPDVSMESKGR